MKVNILLSTYNGEQYLAEQVKSIQEQTYQGGNFSYVTMVHLMEQLKLLNNWLHEIHVFTLSMRVMLKTLVLSKVSMPYLSMGRQTFTASVTRMIFGFPEKISLQVAEAKKYSQDKPLLIYTDLKVVDENLSVLHESMIRTQSDHANTELIQELTENTVTGGVAMINHALAELWTGEEKHDLLMHDWYLVC